MFTFSCRAFMNSTSTGRSLWERNCPCEHWDGSNQSPPHEKQLDCATPCRKPADGKGVVCVFPCTTDRVLLLTACVCVCLCVITRARTEEWSRGSSGLCCPGCSFCSARSHPWSIAQTADLCSLWSASSWNTHTHTHTHFSSSSRLNMAHVSVQQVFQLTTRCCWRRLRTPACRRWSAWAWPLSPRCRQCVWWSPQFGWFALQSIDAQTGRGWWGENKVKLLEQQVRDSVEQARMWMVQNALPVGVIQVSDCFSTPYMINKWFMTVLIL